MEIVSLSSTNFIGLSSVYEPDAKVKFAQRTLFTENGLDITQTETFKKLNDTVQNNYSLLYLTNQQKLTGGIYIENLEKLEDEGFSTYLAVNAIGNITPFSRFLVVQEVTNDINTASVSFSGLYENLDNRYFFDIQFKDEKLCTIMHEFNGVERFLTFDYAGNAAFTPRQPYYSLLGEADPQLFFYIYDRNEDFIVFYKNFSDRVKFLSYQASINAISLIDPLTGLTVPYPTTCVFRCINRNEAPNDTRLFDPWVAYNRNLKTNTQDNDIASSVLNINSNLLINTQYFSNTASELKSNVLSLKNTSTSNNYQYRNNPFQANKAPFFNEDSCDAREYQKLFTGSNQSLGYDNIMTGYETYTTDIVLEKDKVTYFHIPYDFYPYIRLNIAQSGLVEAGAIAGDHPLKSDKIFKKLGNFKYTSHFGETIDEATGSFLCSWLSGNPNVNTPPIWVDRYYNPSKSSFINALTTNPVQSIQYQTQFDCLAVELGELLQNITVFDKPSDLIFEPGTYYAYHHYGPNDVKKYISSLENKLVQKGFPLYFNLDTTNVYTSGTQIEEFWFDGQTYAQTTSLSTVQESGQFTLAFDMWNEDWTKPFAGQIVGNFASDGFGIFNQNTLTPTLYVNTASGTVIFNTDMTVIKNIFYPARVLGYLRFEGINNYYTINSDSYLRKYNANDTLIQELYYRPLSAMRWYDYNNNEGYILCLNINGNDKNNTVAKVDFQQGTLIEIPNTTFNTTANGRFVVDPDATPLNSWTGSSSVFTQGSATTIDYYNDFFYFTPGKTATRIGEDIYYLRDNVIMKWNDITGSSLPATTAFKAYNGVQDFEIDYDGNMWILTDNHKYFKYTLERELLLSGSLVETDPLTGGYLINQYKNLNVGFIADFADGEYYRRTLITQVGYEQLPAPAATPTLSTLSAENYRFHILTSDGILLSTFNYRALTGSGIYDPSNSDHLRKFVHNLYPTANLNVKTVLTNVFNQNDLANINLIYSLTALDPGYHNFAVRFDTYNGFMFLFIDGQQVGVERFTPRKYKFSKFVYRPFLIGTSNYVNSIPLYQYVKKNSGIMSNTKIKNFYLYDEPLNYFDLAFVVRSSMDIQDIHFHVPCGKRNYIEEIERYFKATIPGQKSSQYNLIIQNSGINDPGLRAALESRIITALRDIAPAYTKLNTIKWTNI